MLQLDWFWEISVVVEMPGPEKVETPPSPFWTEKVGWEAPRESC